MLNFILPTVTLCLIRKVSLHMVLQNISSIPYTSLNIFLTSWRSCFFLSSLHPLELGCDLVSLLAEGGGAMKSSLEIP